MKKALSSITVLGIILSFAVIMASAQTAQDIAKIARESSASLKMNADNAGSGFFVLPDQIATAYHIIEGASRGAVSPVLQLYVCNQTHQTIFNIRCLVIFKDKQGQIICADEGLIPGSLYAGEDLLHRTSIDSG